MAMAILEPTKSRSRYTAEGVWRAFVVARYWLPTQLLNERPSGAEIVNDSFSTFPQPDLVDNQTGPYVEFQLSDLLLVLY